MFPSPSRSLLSSAPAFDDAEVLALSALRFRARQTTATFLSRSIDEALVLGAGRIEVVINDDEEGAGSTTAKTAVLVAPRAAPANFSWADAARDALARDARKRRREASGVSERVKGAISSRFSGGRRGGGRGGGRGRGRGGAAASSASKWRNPEPASASEQAAPPPPPPQQQQQLSRVSSLPDAAAAFVFDDPASAPAPAPAPSIYVPRARKRTKRDADEADARYRAAVNAANASAAAAAATAAAGGGTLLSLPSPFGPPVTAHALLTPSRPATVASATVVAAERFVHPTRWPRKSDSVRARGAARLAPVSELVTPRRLRPAPWGVLLRRSENESHGDNDDEKENGQKVSNSFLRVAASSGAPSSSGAAALSSSPSSSCFPRTVVRRSRIAGLGLYALGRISRGSAVAEYSGELVRAPLADMREVGYARLGLGRCFLKSFPPFFFGVQVQVEVEGRRKLDNKKTYFPLFDSLEFFQTPSKQVSTSSQSGLLEGAEAEKTILAPLASASPLPPLLPPLLLLPPPAARHSSSTRR